MPVDIVSIYYKLIEHALEYTSSIPVTLEVILEIVELMPISQGDVVKTVERYTEGYDKDTIEYKREVENVLYDKFLRSIKVIINENYDLLQSMIILD